MPRRAAVPTTPTLPEGTEVASFRTYLEAQRAVDHLSDETFPVQHVSIVGTDLHLVERITGRLTYARVAGAGAVSGAWFGLLVSLLFVLFTPSGQGVPLLAGLVIGAAFGILFGLVSYAFTGGRRDFTSSSQVVAGRYAIICAVEHAARARELLGAEPALRRGMVAGHRPYDPANPYAGPGSTPAGGAPAPVPPRGEPGQGPAGGQPPRDDEPPRYGIRITPPTSPDNGGPGGDPR